VEGISQEVSCLGTMASGQKQEVADLAGAVQQFDSKLSIWRSQVATGVRASAMRDEGESEILRLEAQATAASRADIEERLERLRSELSNATRSLHEFERRLDYNQRQLKDHVQAWSADLKQEIGTSNTLWQEIRSEISAEMRKQREAVSALDEQLWVSDKRLGARIDELSQSHAVNKPDERSHALRLEPECIAIDEPSRNCSLCMCRDAVTTLNTVVRWRRRWQRRQPGAPRRSRVLVRQPSLQAP